MRERERERKREREGGSRDIHRISGRRCKKRGQRVWSLGMGHVQREQGRNGEVFEQPCSLVATIGL
jgi:hypothetical protein